MEPRRTARRPTPMRTLALTVAALTVPLALAGCGSGDDGEGVATDPAPTSAVTSGTPTAEPSPTASPTVGSYPAFEPTDYTYVLTVQCFCLGGGAPVRVTVADGEVTEAVYGPSDQGGGGRGGAEEGTEAGAAFRLTIQDVIDRANDTTADTVTVDWPAGQDHPNSVYVDGEESMADDEVGYTISDVQVG